MKDSECQIILDMKIKEQDFQAYIGNGNERFRGPSLYCKWTWKNQESLAYIGNDSCRLAEPSLDWKWKWKTSRTKLSNWIDNAQERLGEWYYDTWLQETPCWTSMTVLDIFIYNNSSFKNGKIYCFSYPCIFFSFINELFVETCGHSSACHTIDVTKRCLTFVDKNKLNEIRYTQRWCRRGFSMDKPQNRIFKRPLQTGCLAYTTRN